MKSEHEFKYLSETDQRFLK